MKCLVKCQHILSASTENDRIWPMPDLWDESPFLISCCQILTESYSRPRTKMGFFFRKKETTIVEKTTIVSTTKSLVVGRFALRCPKFQFQTKPSGFSSEIFLESSLRSRLRRIQNLPEIVLHNGNAGIRTRDTMIFSFTLAKSEDSTKHVLSH